MEQALLIERYTTYKNKGQWYTRCEAVLYLTSLAEDETTPEDLLARVRGHWRSTQDMSGTQANSDDHLRFVIFRLNGRLCVPQSAML